MAETTLGEPTIREAVISSEICFQWKIYQKFMIKKPEDNMKLQLKELALNNMIKTMFPNLHTITSISFPFLLLCLCREKLLSDETNKRVSTKHLKDTSPSHLMKIVIESPTELADANIEEIVGAWNGKNRRITVYIML